MCRDLLVRGSKDQMLNMNFCYIVFNITVFYTHGKIKNFKNNRQLKIIKLVVVIPKNTY